MGRQEERTLFLENAELRERLKIAEVERDIAYENALGKIINEMVVYSVSSPVLSKDSISVGDLMSPQTVTHSGKFSWQTREGAEARKYKICVMEV